MGLSSLYYSNFMIAGVLNGALLEYTQHTLLHKSCCLVQCTQCVEGTHKLKWEIVRLLSTHFDWKGETYYPHRVKSLVDNMFEAGVGSSTFVVKRLFFAWG